MPKFRIACSTSISWTLDVEAPTKEAAELYYKDCDGSEFTRHEESYGWEFDEIYEVHEDVDAAFVLNEDGEVIEEE